MIFKLKVEQNGGEYHGIVTIHGKTIEKKDGKTIVVDDVVIKFDELIEIFSIQNG